MKIFLTLMPFILFGCISASIERDENGLKHFYYWSLGKDFKAIRAEFKRDPKDGSCTGVLTIGESDGSNAAGKITKGIIDGLAPLK